MKQNFVLALAFLALTACSNASNPTELGNGTFVSKANPFQGEISELAPLAKALMNHKEGEHVNFTTQNEKVHYLVLSVED